MLCCQHREIRVEELSKHFDLGKRVVEIFRALEEARQARLLLHVVDASNPQAEEQIKAVNAVLDELGCGGKPSLLVLNKVDRVTDVAQLRILEAHHPRAVEVSAATGQGLDGLREAVVELLSVHDADVEVTLPQADGKLLAFLGAHADIYHQQYRDEAVVVRCHLPRHLLHHVAGEGVAVREVGG